MTWKGFLAAVFAVPALTLFLGVGVLAWNVGQTWDARSTDSLIAGLISVCAGGVFLAVLLLALIVGVPLALRAYERGAEARQAWQEPRYRVLPPALPQSWVEQPPMIEDKNVGSWQSTGMGYDLWEDEPNTPAHQ